MFCSQYGTSGDGTSVTLVQTEDDQSNYTNWHIIEVELTATLDA